MLKKILYIIVSVVLGFVVFYISWRNSYSRAIVNKGNAALEKEDYEFFCKFLDYYEKDELFVEQYTENNNTTTIRAYNVFFKHALDKDEKTVSRSGVLLLVTNINMEEVKIDEETPDTDEDDEEIVTMITLTANTGSTFSTKLSTYGYDSTPICLFTISSTETIDELTTSTYPTAPTSINHIKLVDPDGKVFFDKDVTINLAENNEEEYWTNLVNEGKAGVAFTAKEARSYFTFSFPEMNRTLIITGVTIILLAAFGLFIFWPKKSYVPTEEVDRETYTFASTDEKEKYALAKVARSKKEKEDRENRYKNVRTDSNLENMSNEAIKESMDKENTAEAALAEDAKLEEENKEETKEEN